MVGSYGVAISYKRGSPVKVLTELGVAHDPARLPERLVHVGCALCDPVNLQCMAQGSQVFLAHKKQRPPRTLQ